MPELAGKLHGFAVRVPVPTGSLVDLTVELERPTTVDEVNALFATRADHGELAGILRYSEEPLVSSDIVKSPYSSIFDAPLTTVVDGTPAEGRRVVRQRVGLLEPARRARAASAGTRPGRGADAGGSLTRDDRVGSDSSSSDCSGAEEHGASRTT